MISFRYQIELIIKIDYQLRDSKNIDLLDIFLVSTITILH